MIRPLVTIRIVASNEALASRVAAAIVQSTKDALEGPGDPPVRVVIDCEIDPKALTEDPPHTDEQVRRVLEETERMASQGRWPDSEIP